MNAIAEPVDLMIKTQDSKPALAIAEKPVQNLLDPLIDLLKNPDTGASFEDKFVIIIEIFEQLGLGEIKNLHQGGQTKEATEKLIQFIKDNEDILELEVLPLENADIVDQLTNSSQGDNHSAIRNAIDLKDLASKAREANLLAEAEILESASKKAEAKKIHVLLIDKMNENEFYKNLIHEFDIWVLNGAYISQINTTNDWHDKNAPYWRDTLQLRNITIAIDSWMTRKTPTTP